MKDAIDEQTMAELREIIARYPQPRSAMLPMLHLLQSVEGRVTSRGIETCAELLDISAAEVAGVATFYTMYKRRPVGDYHVGVCTNTLCAVMGGDAILERLEEHLGIGNDETTVEDAADGAAKSITLEHVECNAACDYAPVVMVNWEFMDNQTPESATALVDALRAGEEVTSTRGPRICTWKQAERVLAGFPDDRADEGPAGGPATLVGLAIARENGWVAPGGSRERRSGGTSQQAQESLFDTEPSKAAEHSDSGRAEADTLADPDPGKSGGRKGGAPVEEDDRG
ncbi:MAG TPA: NADH-quinone oxidoreductase subunit NuoE [Nocardioidaceae bacterium]|nr:NADH-quinone oxidoreductase subunit NuoE [Nocardioidaceae bacterium]